MILLLLLFILFFVDIADPLSMYIDITTATDSIVIDVSVAIVDISISIFVC
jgi:hypothetical protein